VQEIQRNLLKGGAESVPDETGRSGAGTSSTVLAGIFGKGAAGAGGANAGGAKLNPTTGYVPPYDPRSR
jgi:hypothetical protein